MLEPRLRSGKKRGRTRFVEVRTKTVLTRNGTYDIPRPCYECRYCGTPVVPFDDLLGVAGRERTVGVDRAITTVACEMPFLPAKRVIEELTGIDVSDQTVREVAEAAGREAMAMLDADVEAAKTAKLEPAGGVLDWRKVKLPFLYVGPDGSMVPMRPEDRPEQKATDEHPGTHREAKAAVIFWGADLVNVSEKRREILKKTYVATMGGVDDFRDKVWAGALAVAGDRRFQPVVLGDGADWITNLTDELFPDAIRIVDFYHVLERIHEVARLLHGRSSIPGKAWAKEQKVRLEASKIDEVLAALDLASNAEPHQKGDRQALREKCEEHKGYIEKRRAFMDYARYREMGLMIGSGSAESGHKRLIGQRLKGAGMHWSLKGANEMVHLRALRLSDGPGWERLWARLAKAG